MADYQPSEFDSNYERVEGVMREQVISEHTKDCDVVFVPDGWKVYVKYVAIAHLRPGSNMREMKIAPADMKRFASRTREWLTQLAGRQGWVMEWDDE